MRSFGQLVLGCGVVVALFFFFFFDPSVEVPTQQIMGQEIGGGRVMNLGLMADRQNGILIGIGAAVLGIILIAISGNEPQHGERLCPFCKGVIQKSATKCKFCASDVPPV